MLQLTAPSSTIVSHADVVNGKLKDQQNSKADNERFMLELFALLQKNNALLLNQQFDQLQVPLQAVARDGGYQDLPAALNFAKNARGQTALVKALQEQEFGLASTLLKFGAQYDAQAEAEFDIAISRPH